MKLYLFVFCSGLLAFSIQSALAQSNELTAAEKDAGFDLIFGGKDFEGWQQNGNWIIDEEGAMFRKEKGGGIAWKKYKVYDDFELRFEWKVGEKSNSGLYYRPTQYEYQILANQGHGNGKNPRTSAASLYFCMAPSHDATMPPGEWNTGKIVGKGTVIQHWLNGEKVISFDYTDPTYAKQVELLKIRGGDLTKRGAFLSLQDHGDPVWYRTIRIRELKEGDEIDPGFVTPAEIPESELAAERKKLEGILARRKKAAEAKKK